MTMLVIRTLGREGDETARRRGKNPGAVGFKDAKSATFWSLGWRPWRGYRMERGRDRGVDAGNGRGGLSAVIWLSQSVAEGIDAFRPAGSPRW